LTDRCWPSWINAIVNRNKLLVLLFYWTNN